MKNYFSVQGLDGSVFVIQNFTTENYGISKHYSYAIQATSSYSLSEKALTNKKAHLTINWGRDQIYVHGIISKWSHLGKDENNHFYSITLVSPLFDLEQNSHARVFLNQSVLEIVEKVLQQADWHKDLYKIKTTAQYPSHEFTVQLNESDLDFVQRLLSQEGLFYIFQQQPNQAKLLILDDIINLPKFSDQTLNYQSQSGAVRPEESLYTINERIHLLTDNFRLKQYNHQTPEVDLDVISKNKTNIPGQGTQYLYGCNVQNLEQGQQLVNIYQQATDRQRQTFIAETDCRGLQPGQSFSLTDHPLKKYNTEYRIIDMEISAAKLYQAKLLLINANIPYRTLPIPNPEIHHTIPATIESNGGDYAYLDEQGRYHLRLPFDQSKNPRGAASLPVRAVQPTTGMHFPLHNGIQVALGFIAGDINRPIILGVINDPNNPSPVTSGNYTQNSIKTWGDNEITMDDLENREQILFSTRDQLNQLKLDAKQNQQQINLETKQGKIEAYAGDNININTAETYTTKTDKDQLINIANNQQIITQNGDIEHQSGRDILLNAKRDILQQTKNNNINFKTANDFLLETGSDLHWQVEHRDLQMQTQEGDINLYADKTLSMQGSNNADMFTGSGDNGITVTKDGDLNFNGSKIILEAPEINIYQNAAINSNADITRAMQQASEERANHPEYKYYIVNNEGFKMPLAIGFLETLKDIATDFNLADGFETERWIRNDVETNDDLRIKNEAWKGKYEAQRITSSEQELDRNAILKAGAVGVSVSVINFTYKEALKHQLLEELKELQPKIEKMMLNDGGVLVEAGYLFFDDGNSQSLELKYVFPVRAGSDYTSLIKQVMTGPFAISTPPKLAHWEFLFIWVVKKQEK